MLELVAPTAALHGAWLEAHREWGPGLHEDGFGLRPSDAVDSVRGFTVWLTRLRNQSDPVRAAATGRAPAVYRWIVEDGRVLGGIALRTGDDEFVHTFGHIGYGVRPSARSRGVATWALGRILDEARNAGLARVLIVCEAGNAASAATIERCGGVLEAVVDTEHGAARRYWVEL